MEQDTNVTDSSTSAKRSKLEDMLLPKLPKPTDFNGTSSCSNDIEMTECSNTEATPLSKNTKDEEVMDDENTNKIPIELDTNKTSDNECTQNNQCTNKSVQEAIIEEIKDLKTENELLEEETSIDNESVPKNVVNTEEKLKEEEMKEASKTANTNEQEAGPSESDTVRKPRNRNRHYRPRRISSSESSLNNSNMDISNDEAPAENSDSDHANEESDHSNNEDESDGEIIYATDSTSDSSFHDLDYLESNDTDEEQDVSDEVNSTQEILTKEKPNYKTNLLYEIIYREHGLSGPGISYKRQPDPLTFQSTINNSRLTIEKLRVMHNLRKHRGCVNSLNFNRSGNILCTGSDDLKIILWDWANNKTIHSFLSGHNSNVFQTKFIDIGSGTNIVSSARDGQVRHQIMPPSGSKNSSTVLFKHSGPVHKIAVCKMNPYEILTAGEDAYVVRCDLREKPIERLVTVRGKNNQRIDLYSVAHNPLDQEFCVCGRDQFVRVYDKRNVKEPVYLMFPEKFVADNKHHDSYITCAVYNQTGTEILASYNDGDIYLFNNKCYLKGHFTHQYRGHLNYKTIKGVNFFGPNSEYVVSGSDCGNMFIWDKETEVILNWQKGDRSGIINCLEPHPSFPILATSGLDYDAKIWCPISETIPPEMEGLEKCVKQNARRLALNKSDVFSNRTFLFFISECQRTRFRRTRLLNRNTYPDDQDDDYPVVQDIASSSSSEHSTDLDDDDDVRMPCTTQ